MVEQITRDYLQKCGAKIRAIREIVDYLSKHVIQRAKWDEKNAKFFISWGVDGDTATFRLMFKYPNIQSQFILLTKVYEYDADMPADIVTRLENVFPDTIKAINLDKHDNLIQIEFDWS